MASLLLLFLFLLFLSVALAPSLLLFPRLFLTLFLPAVLPSSAAILFFLWRRQGDTVRALKAAKAERAAVDEAIKKLQGLKLELESATKAYMAHADVSKGDSSINREKFRQEVNNALERRWVSLALLFCHTAENSPGISPRLLSYCNAA